MMRGPEQSGAVVKCFKRGARNVVAGDWLPEHDATVIVAPYVADDGRVWVSLDNGSDLDFTPRGKVWLYRRYSAPAWMAAAVEDYRHARHAWEALRESSDPIPAGAVAGASGSGVAWCQLEDSDFRAAMPAPRLADHIRAAAAARRDS
jgi:hypothetical protein